MNVHQLTGDISKLRRSGGTAIDPCPAFALQINRTAQQQAIACFEAGFLQPIRQTSGAVEFSAYFTARHAFADHAGISTSAKSQLQRVDQYRFACPGFSCENCKSA